VGGTVNSGKIAPLTRLKSSPFLALSSTERETEKQRRSER
jgi:hypothetical protein